MADRTGDEFASLLKILPAVEFCCVYGSFLHPNNSGKSTMVDYILGVRDPLQWHGENLKLNSSHYASWILHLGGANLITGLANGIGVGVHFNPYVACDGKVLFGFGWNRNDIEMFKYGVVGVNDLIQDMITWDRFYLSGRLQKPVRILVDRSNIGIVNLINLRAATAAALFLLPPKFTEEDLYAKICSLSYMGDLRMLFAEDRDKVRKIVRGQLGTLQLMYKPILEEFQTRDLFKVSSFGCPSISQDCSLSSSQSLVTSLPITVRNLLGMEFGELGTRNQTASGAINEVPIKFREVAAKCIQKAVKRAVMRSSARQAVSGVLAAGAVNATRYFTSKVHKAFKSCIN